MRRGGAGSPFVGRLEWETALQATRIVTVSHAMKDDLNCHGWPPHKISVVWNGVDPRDDAQIWPPVLSANTWRPEVVEGVLRMGKTEMVNDMGGLPDGRNARRMRREDQRGRVIGDDEVGAPRGEDRAPPAHEPGERLIHAYERRIEDDGFDFRHALHRARTAPRQDVDLHVELQPLQLQLRNPRLA